MKRDYYEVLGVSRTADDSELKSAYRKQALRYHPDRNPDDKDAEEKFKECNEAYSILSDQQKRAAYDRYGHDAFNAGGFGGQASGYQTVDINDIFGDIFDIFGGGSQGARRTRSRAQRGDDIRADLNISFEEAAFGIEREVELTRLEACEACHGSGAAEGRQPSTCRQCGGQGQIQFQQGFFSVARTCPVCGGTGTVIEKPCAQCRGQRLVRHTHTMQVKVPAGVEDGTRILYNGHGNAGLDGGPAGDAYVILHVAEHPFFERDGQDLLCAIPISITQAALGAKVTIPTLEGEATVEIPAGTQTGTTFRLRKKGVPILHGNGRGDLFVEVKVTVPEKLTREQRDLLVQLAATLSPENRPQKRSLLNKVKSIFS